MKKRSSLSSGSGNSLPFIVSTSITSTIADAVAAVKNARKIRGRDEDYDDDESEAEAEELDIAGDDDDFGEAAMVKQSLARKRRKSSQ